MQGEFNIKHCAALFVAALLIAVAFAQGVPDELRLDSRKILTPYVTHNPFPSLLDWSFSGNSGGVLGRPVSMLSFLTQSAVGLDSIEQFAWVNIVLHLLVFGAIVVFLIIAQNIYSPSASNQLRNALIVGFLWAALPIHASSVLYLVQRMTILAALFLIISLSVGLLWLKNRRGNSHRSLALSAICILSFFLALFSKENAAIGLPIFAYFWLTLEGRESNGDRSQMVKIFCLNLVIVCVLFIAYAYFRNSFQGREFDINTRLIYQVQFVWLYLKQILLPDIASLGIYHDDILAVSNTSLLATVTSGLALALLLILQIRLVVSKDWALVSLGITFFLYGHLVESTVVPLELYFEHRNYFPSLGVIIVVLNFVQKVQNYFDRSRYVKFLLISVMSFYYVGLVRASIPYGSTTLFVVNTVSQHPYSARAHADAAIYFSRIGDINRSLGHLERFVALKPVGSELEQASLQVTLTCLSGVALSNELVDRFLNASDVELIKDELSITALKSTLISEKCSSHAFELIAHMVDIANAKPMRFAQLHALAVLAYEAGAYQEVLSVTDVMLEARPSHIQTLFIRMQVLMLLDRKVDSYHLFEKLERANTEGLLGNYQEQLLEVYRQKISREAE